jgi:hypothetical protein
MATNHFVLQEDPVAVIDTSPRFKTNALYWYKHTTYGWCMFRYFKFLSTAAVDVGDCCEFMDLIGVEVGPDRDQAGFIALCPAGVAVGTTVTSTSWGFVQISGPIVSILRTDGAVVAADYLVTSGDDDEADTMAAGEEEQVFAMANAADGADNLTAGQALFKGLV